MFHPCITKKEPGLFLSGFSTLVISSVTVECSNNNQEDKENNDQGESAAVSSSAHENTPLHVLKYYTYLFRQRLDKHPILKKMYG